MNLEFIGFTIEVVGKVLVAYTALMVHHRMRLEHKIDRKVFMEMQRERMFGIVGIALIIIGYFLQAPFVLQW